LRRIALSAGALLAICIAARAAYNETVVSWSTITTALGITPTAHSVLLGGTSALGQAAVGTGGRVLIDQGGSADPAFTAVAGDATLSAGGTLTIGSNAVTYAKQAQAAANTLAGNATGSTANKTDISVPSCTLTALQWTGGSGFSCPTNFAASVVAGTTTNDNATAGDIGEIMTSDIATASAVSLSSGSPGTVTSLSLTAGDWDCYGTVITKPAASTTTSQVQAWISSSTSIPAALETNNGWGNISPLTAANSTNSIRIGPSRVSLSGTTTIYLQTQVTFATSTMAAYGIETCRRAR